VGRALLAALVEEARRRDLHTLVGVIDATDFADVVSRLNRTLQDLWPCGPAYYCG
jgi:hypothetical protein